MAGLQLSLVQGLPSSHEGGAPLEQLPFWQVAVPLQTLPSSQAVPLATLAWAQPLAGLQLSLVQGLLSSHEVGVPGTQLPAWQVAVPLQTLPSSQAVPFGTLS